MEEEDEKEEGGARTRSSNLRSPLGLELVFVDDSRGIQRSEYLLPNRSYITDYAMLRFFLFVVVARGSRLFRRFVVDRRGFPGRRTIAELLPLSPGVRRKKEKRLDSSLYYKIKSQLTREKRSLALARPRATTTTMAVRAETCNRWDRIKMAIRQRQVGYRGASVKVRPG